MRRSYINSNISYVIMILIAVQSVFFSIEEYKEDLVESSFNTSSSESITELAASESSILIENNNSSDSFDNCHFCCCCHLFLVNDYSCNILQEVDYLPTYALVSSELKGYMSVPFRPPKYA